MTPFTLSLYYVYSLLSFSTQPPSLSLQVIYILEANALKPLRDLLVVKDAKIVQVLLDGLLNILNAR